jgi:hypothetical protein
MEFVMVVFPTKRSVNVDGVLTGNTNENLRMEAGTHRFDLGDPADYEPVSQEVVVQGTTVLRPMKVVFTKKGGQP